MKFELTPVMIIAIGISVLFLALVVFGVIGKEWFALFIVIIVIMFFVASKQRRIITIDEAMEKSKQWVKQLQMQNVLPDGDITLMHEAELKNLLVLDDNPSIEPIKYDVAVKIAGDIDYAFLIQISVYGNFMGVTKINSPTSFRIKKSAPQIRTMQGRPKVIEKLADGTDQQKEEKNKMGNGEQNE